MRAAVPPRNGAIFSRRLLRVQLAPQKDNTLVAMGVITLSAVLDVRLLLFLFTLFISLPLSITSIDWFTLPASIFVFPFSCP